jgi:hypothetical protein
MNTESKPSQAEQILKLKPDFSHRLSILGDEAKPHLLSDAINTKTRQAKSILRLICSQLMLEDKDRLSDEIIYDSVESVIEIINDIDAISDAYYEAHKLSN